MVSVKNGCEPGLCDVTVALQFVYRWGGANASVLGRGLGLVDERNRMGELNQSLLFVANSEEKLCRFGNRIW